MTEINFKTPQGDLQTVTATDGESLMKVAVQNGLPGIEGECGGEMSCATCHVYIAEPWKSQLLAASVDELDLLEFDDNVTGDSRLACQVRVRDSLDGALVVIP